MRFATPDPVLTALRAGGESLHTVMGPVLEAAIEVLEQHSISSPRKARRPLRDIIDRAEVIVDAMDRVWCDTVSRSAELEHLAQLMKTVQDSTSVATPQSDTASAVCALLDCLQSCESTRGISPARGERSGLLLAAAETAPARPVTPSRPRVTISSPISGPTMRASTPPRGEPDSFRASSASALAPASASATTSPARGRTGNHRVARAKIMAMRSARASASPKRDGAGSGGRAPI
jgi:hypothetical protein